MNTFNSKYINILFIIILLLISTVLLSTDIVYKEKDNIGTLWDNWSADSMRYFFQASTVDSLASRIFSEPIGYDGLMSVYLMVDTLGAAHDTITVNNGKETKYLYTHAFDSGGIVVKLRRYISDAIGWKEHQLTFNEYGTRSNSVDTVKFANIGKLYVCTFRPDSLNSWFSDAPTSYSFDLHNAIDDDSVQTWKILLEVDIHRPNRR